MLTPNVLSTADHRSCFNVNSSLSCIMLKKCFSCEELFKLKRVWMPIRHIQLMILCLSIGWTLFYKLVS